MRSANRLLDSLRCKICEGPFVQATSILPCMHTYCRSCVIKHCQCTKACPQCGSYYEPRQEYLRFRFDHTLQRMVYLLLPKHFQDERDRMLELYKLKKGSSYIQVFLLIGYRLENSTQNLELRAGDLRISCPLEMNMSTLKTFAYHRLVLDPSKHGLKLYMDHKEIADDLSIISVILLYSRLDIEHPEGLKISAIVTLPGQRMVRSTDVEEGTEPVRTSETHVPRYSLRKRVYKSVESVERGNSSSAETNRSDARSVDPSYSCTSYSSSTDDFTTNSGTSNSSEPTERVSLSEGHANYSPKRCKSTMPPKRIDSSQGCSKESEMEKARSDSVASEVTDALSGHLSEETARRPLKLTLTRRAEMLNWTCTSETANEEPGRDSSYSKAASSDNLIVPAVVQAARSSLLNGATTLPSIFSPVRRASTGFSEMPDSGFLMISTNAQIPIDHHLLNHSLSSKAQAARGDGFDATRPRLISVKSLASESSNTRECDI